MKISFYVDAEGTEDKAIILASMDTGHDLAEVFTETVSEARHIVKCVNYHDRLVEALDELVDMWPGRPTQEWENARAILQELEGEL